MKLYCKNEKPFVYAVFSSQDKEQAIAVLQKTVEDGVPFWFSEQFSKKEIRRIEAAFSCILFISKNSILDEKVRHCIAYAEKYNKKILCIYLEPTVLSPGNELQLNSLQSIDMGSFSDDQAFGEKLKSAEVFSGMQITAAQKRFAKRRGLASVFIPVVSAVAIFFAVVVPLLVLPMVQAATGSLSKVGFGNLSLAELAKVEQLNVIGTQSFDRWYFAFYMDTKNEVYVNEMNITLPKGDISDISDLALLTNAKEIAFEANEVSDISPLYKIKTLESLTLNCNPITSIEGIEALQNLKDITLVLTEVSDISPLFKIPSLERISFENTYVSSIEGIENLKRLVDLRSGNSNVTDISPLNKIDFSYINELTDGFSFEAKDSLIKDFSPLQRIPKFNEIMVGIKRISNILPYISNKPVFSLYIAGSDINAISQLSSIQNIQMLHLPYSSQLNSIGGIENHVDLEELNLVNCPNIDDLSPLLKLPKLKRLVIGTDKENLAAAQLAGAAFEIAYQDN
ncbi:MAG: leucine-rich repeat domain-containing protein [Christensenellales bacterium]